MGNIEQVRGGKLQKMRTDAGLTQKKVADHFGIDKSAVSEWEHGGGIATDKLRRLDVLYKANGAVLSLFDVGEASGSDNTVETVRLELTALAEIVDALSKKLDKVQAAVGRLRSGDVAAKRGASS